MAANTTPIFPLTPNVAFGSVATANNVYDGTGTVVTIFTAGTNGSRLDQIRLKPLGTNIATVIRFFINNGSTNTTASNNAILDEVTLAATTASATAALYGTTLFYGFTLPAGYKINVVVGTTVAAGWMCIGQGGDY